MTRETHRPGRHLSRSVVFAGLTVAACGAEDQTAGEPGTGSSSERLVGLVYVVSQPADDRTQAMGGFASTPVSPPLLPTLDTCVTWASADDAPYWTEATGFRADRDMGDIPSLRLFMKDGRIFKSTWEE